MFKPVNKLRTELLERKGKFYQKSVSFKETKRQLKLEKWENTVNKLNIRKNINLPGF